MVYISDKPRKLRSPSYLVFGNLPVSVKPVIRAAESFRSASASEKGEVQLADRMIPGKKGDESMVSPLP